MPVTVFGNNLHENRFARRQAEPIVVGCLWRKGQDRCGSAYCVASRRTAARYHQLFRWVAVQTLKPSSQWRHYRRGIRWIKQIRAVACSRQSRYAGPPCGKSRTAPRRIQLFCQTTLTHGIPPSYTPVFIRLLVVRLVIMQYHDAILSTGCHDTSHRPAD